MRTFKPIYLIVLIVLAVTGWMGWMGWRFYQGAQRWNAEADRPAPSPMDAYTFVDVAPIEDHSFRPPRVHSISVQIDGRQTGHLVVELMDSATRKTVLSRSFAYNGSLSARKEIEIGHLGPGIYFSTARFDGVVKHTGRVEVK